MDQEKISRRQFLKRASLRGIGCLAAAYPFLIERYIILTNHYRLPVPNLPREFHGLRIVHLSDLHYGFLVPLTLLEHVIQHTNSLSPDVIVCTGDYVHERNSTHQIDIIWPLLSRLRAPLGVHTVLGNHDHWADTDRSDYWLKRAGQDLRHKKTRLEKGGQHLWLAGAGDFLTDHQPLDTVLGDIPEQECRILLAHNPDTMDTAYSARIDLALAGHTHGGQVVVPFIGPPILPVNNREYTSGLRHSTKGTGVFISRGIGWTHFPVRFNCYPEIAVLELVSPSILRSTSGSAVGVTR